MHNDRRLWHAEGEILENCHYGIINLSYRKLAERRSTSITNIEIDKI